MLRLLLLLLPALTLAQAPSYSPYNVTCPSTPLLNSTGSPLTGNQTLSPGESSYISSRKQQVAQVWQQYLSNTTFGDTGYNATIQSDIPTIAVAASGGGLRASLNGAGAVSAIDGRNATSVAPILQLASYITGLSGGSWFVSSLAMNDLPDMFSLVLGNNASNINQTGWQLQYNIISPADGLLSIGNDASYYSDLISDVNNKSSNMFPVSLTDTWGRALAYHFANGTTSENFFDDSVPHAQGLIWSSIKYTQNFQAFQMPLPIVVSTSRVSEAAQEASMTTTVLPLNNTVFEFSPYSFGSFDPNLTTIMPIEFAGTPLNNGSPANSTSCLNNYENFGFIIGTSASLFNAIDSVPGADALVSFVNTIGGLITGIQKTPNSVDLVANWPNSFQNYKTGVFEQAGNDILQLTDGGEAGENIPLQPLLVKARQVDIIFAIDSSADTDYYWPNGTSLIATQDRVTGVLPSGWASFPSTPTSQAQYVAQGLNTRPTFFGCNETGTSNSTTPIVVYLPNAPVSGYSNTNTSTFQLGYSESDTLNFLLASHANGIRGIPNSDGSADSAYPLALKCIMAEPSRRRAGIPVSSACTTVLNKYCWNGSTNADVSQAPGANVTGGSNSGGGSSNSNDASSPFTPFKLSTFLTITIAPLLASVLLVQ